MYDGKSPITAKATNWQAQHEELWNLLVPSNGPATTLQGEVIRLAGKIGNELEGNGGINWDADYKLMADAFVAYVKHGTPLSVSDLDELERTVKAIKQRSTDTGRMAEFGVKWVLSNPMPVKLPDVAYIR